MIIRIVFAFKLFWWAFKNTQVLGMSNFKMLSDILALILKVARERRHMMTHIAFVHPQEGTDHEIVSIWAGAGIGATPVKRISELLKENQELKYQLANMTFKDHKVDEKI